ncbi:MAG: hypothetical protein DI565_00960 [Ancylobacter novellus]|uniref:Uncharacterized protein n=1 Tax=Ancylobacter novellus TaxID=921 RepID=A0A2W5KSB2_ANCNO|nr:MAG: hypothetical protein DI565_00960 [Ancylobacter novellus]
MGYDAAMRWSKTRQTLENRFAAPVRERVAIHVTRYHGAPDQEGELWMTIDGKKIYGSSYYAFIKGLSELAPPSSDWRPAAVHAAAELELQSRGIVSHGSLIAAAIKSLNHSIDEMIRSPHPFIRALAVLDRRMGRRRLASLDIGGEHELVRMAAALRAAPTPAPDAMT